MDDKFRYKVLRKENNKKVILAQYSFEDVETFKAVAKNPNYIITEDGKVVTSKYKRMK